MHLIVHVSDLHFCDDLELRQSDKVVAALRGLDAHPSSATLVVSGDIANTGTLDDYAVADSYIRNLLEGISDLLGYEANIVVCPGNHDCDFNEDIELRNMAVENIKGCSSAPQSKKVLDACTEVQRAFFIWGEEIGAIPRDREGDLSWSKVVVGDQGAHLTFRSLNTSWMSDLNERPGTLYFPANECNPDTDTDLVVTVMHHPYNWFQPDNARVLRSTLEARSSLILTGHEHVEDSYSVVRNGEPDASYIEGGAFRTDDQNCAETFNVILLDSDQRRYSVRKFRWDGRNCRYTEFDATQWATFPSAETHNGAQKRLSQDTSEWLSEPGLNLTHRDKTVSLLDIFVPPDMETYSLGSDAEDFEPKIIRSEHTLGALLADKYAYVFGEAQSGRTSLCKMLFRETLKAHLTPLLLTGSQVKDLRDRSLKRQIAIAGNHQYSEFDEEEYWQLDRAERIVIVDDLEDGRLTAVNCADLANWLHKRFGGVYIVGNTLSPIESAVGATGTAVGSAEFHRYKIRPFGHLLRDKLIEKWLGLGRANYADIDDFSHAVRQSADFIDSLLGDSLLPANPAYVLIVLQQREAGTPLDVKNGTYGYIYQHLLNLALARDGATLTDLDMKHTFLAEFAWYLLVENESANEIDECRFDEFMRDHVTKYAIAVEPADLKADLTVARVLEIHRGSVKFGYRYFLYFYVARYMADNMDEESVKSRIDRATLELHRTDHANILMFLTFHTRNQSIVRQIVQTAKTVFADVKPCDLGQHVAFLSQVMDEIPQINLDGTDPSEARRERMAALDSHNDDSSEDTVEDDPGEGDEVDLLLTINRAVKSIQILGQIVRNFSGSFPDSLKREVVEECFSLGLRMLNSFYGALDRNLQDMLQEFSEMLRRDLASRSGEAQVRLAKRILFMISEIFAIGVLRRVSFAVGSETLQPTLRNMQLDMRSRAGGESRAAKFVHLDIRLNHFKAFPRQDIDELYREVKDDPYGLTLLRMLVSEHFEMFPRHHTTIQSTCQKLGISYGRVRRNRRRRR